MILPEPIIILQIITVVQTALIKRQGGFQVMNQNHHNNSYYSFKIFPSF